MNSADRPPDRDGLRTRLTPPDGGSPASQSGRRQAPIMVSVLFALLVAGAVGVLVLQPGDQTALESPPTPADSTPDRPAADTNPQPVQAQDPAAVEPERAEPERAEPEVSESELSEPKRPAETPAGVPETYRQALALEEEGRLEAALALLQPLAAAAAPYEPAREALDRIRQRLAETMFQEEMQHLFAALDTGDFVAAGQALQRLEQLHIHPAEVAQAAALLAERQRRGEIERLKGQAEAYRAGEVWPQALAAYEAISVLDPDLLFASAGRQEAARRAELDASLSAALERPQRLQDEARRTAAANLLSFAAQVEPRGPRLQAQITALETLIDTFATPVTVVLESNNQTRVTIYHVGRIEPFFTTEIELKPGTYTVVGSRLGYRDVRKEITVAPGSGDLRHDIRCEDAI